MRWKRQAEPNGLICVPMSVRALLIWNRRFTSAQKRLLHKFGLSHPIDRKPLRAEKAQFEQEIEELRPDLNAVQSELDELKTVRNWVRKVIPDALPNRTESGAPSVMETLEVSQNQNELTDLLERTAKQVVSPQQEDEQRTP